MNKKYVLKLIVLLLINSSALADNYNWNGIGSVCGDLLQTCIGGTSSNDVIYINTNNLINEDIIATHNVSLIAGEGYKPVFTEGNSITIHGNGDIRVSGLTLQRGSIEVVSENLNHNVDISIENNVIEDSIGRYGIRYERPSTVMVEASIANVYIKNNRYSNHLEAPLNSGISLENSYRGEMNVYVENNEVFICGNTEDCTLSTVVGIEYINDGSYNQTYFSDIVIMNNSIKLGSQLTGIGININAHSDGTGWTNQLKFNRVVIYNNLLTSIGVTDDSGLYGIKTKARELIGEYSILNNSIINFRNGVKVESIYTDSTAEIVLYNNLIIGNISSVTDIDSKYIYIINVPNDSGNSNIAYRPNSGSSDSVYGYFENGGDHFFDQSTEIPTDLFVNELRPRLTDTSFAKNSGDISSLLHLPINKSFVDIDGTPRIKGTDIDVGAFEFDESGMMDLFSTITGDDFYLVLDHNELNGSVNNNLDNVHFTQNLYIGRYENKNLALANAFDFWNILTQDDSNLSVDVAVNIKKIADDSAYNIAYQQTHNPGVPTNIMVLSDPNLINQPDKILQVSQVLDETSDYNNRPIGVYYNSLLMPPRWELRAMDYISSDPQTLSSGSVYNVYFQDPSDTAWVHTVTASNKTFIGTGTILDHELINNKECALIQVTQEAIAFAEYIPNPPPGHLINYYNNSPIGVDYDVDSGRWSIVNLNGGHLKVGAKFHVIINPKQIEETVNCNRLGVPNFPEILFPANGAITSEINPTVSGLAEPGTLVTVSGIIDTLISTCSDTVDSSGNWSCQFDDDFEDGLTEITARASDEGGMSTSDSISITIDTISPEPANCTVDPAIANDETELLATCTNVQSDAILTIPNYLCGSVISNEVECFATAGPGGVLGNEWATVTEPSTNFTTSIVLFLYDNEVAAPVCTVEPPIANEETEMTATCIIVNESTPIDLEIAGYTTCTVGSRSFGDIITVVCTGFAGVSGVDGNEEAIVTDQAGNINRGDVSFIYDNDVVAPIINSPTDGANANGTGEPGATVYIFSDSDAVCSAIVANDGSWNCTMIPTPIDLETVTGGQIDVAGNISSTSTAIANSDVIFRNGFDPNPTAFAKYPLHQNLVIETK